MNIDFDRLKYSLTGEYEEVMLEREIDQLKAREKEHQRLNGELREENKKLNNIINELERYINEEYIYDELGMKIFDASKLQDKLEELKGDE